MLKLFPILILLAACSATDQPNDAANTLPRAYLKDVVMKCATGQENCPVQMKIMTTPYTGVSGAMSELRNPEEPPSSDLSCGHYDPDCVCCCIGRNCCCYCFSDGTFACDSFKPAE